MRLITFDPLWETMKKKGVTTYTLITKYSFSKGTLDAMKHNRSITLTTLNDICSILGRSVEDVILYISDEIADIEFQNSIPAISFIKQEKELGFLPAPFLRFGIIRTAP